ncbi:helix-turn-helix domain-containing protein [Saccharothrix sp. NRRL B-16314]|uniref:helix-turn-helix domain-containing protein n=1 Tax=Saccharothrix sp. NRRL B-16314 TaxID=1463825 RepID=UPI0006923B15|nr:helix-turn-helix transcriptional regulator [Saccharothrix sp. NRRL B-16314]
MHTDEKDPTPPRLSTARSRELGEELRRIRHRVKMSSAATAEALGWSLGKLSKLEAGSRGASPVEIGTLTGLLGADKPTRDRVLAIATEPDTGNFLRPHDRVPDSLVALSLHEQAARTITAYEPLTVPALAQTGDYTHALTGDHALVRARIARQTLLLRTGGPDTVLYVHESALRTVVGGPAPMRDQMLHLTLMCGWPRVRPRLVPASAGFHAALGRPATLLTFTPPTRPLAYVEIDTVTVFQDAPDAVTLYEAKMRRLDSLALSPAQSRDVFARWADTYDRETD